MLNISSQQSIDKTQRQDQETSEQQNSQAELMAMPTAGGEAEEFDPENPHNLDFDTNRPLNMSSSAQIKAKRSVINSQSRPTSKNNNPLYAREQ